MNAQRFCRHLLLFVTLPLILVVTGCTPDTVLRLAVDVDSYLPEADRTVEFPVPAVTGITAYLLPGIQVDELGAGPDENMQGGLKFDLPVVPADADLKAEFAVMLRIGNLSGDLTIAPWTLRLVLGDAETENIHADGFTIGTVEFAAIQAGAEHAEQFIASVEEGDPAFDVLRTGSARVGVSAQLEALTTGPVPVTLEVEEIAVDVSFRAFSLFKLR